MNPVIFQGYGVLPADRYLPGQARWNYGVRLTGALVQGRGPDAGTCRLQLEVDGDLTGEEIALPAGGDRTVTLALNRLVPAMSEVRWRVAYDGAPETAAMAVSLTLTAVAQSVSQVTARPPVLTVRWVNRQERLTLFNYDPATHLFSAASPDLTSGRATITQTGDTSLAIALLGTPALVVTGGVMYAPQFYAVGRLLALGSPQLIFCVDEAPVAVLMPASLWLVSLTEGTPAALAPGDDGFDRRFEFYSAGGLTAALNAGGLTALEIREPLP